MKKMLIIEDDKSLRIKLEEDFRESGYHVATTHNGRFGLELALEVRFDIILLKFNLPELNGSQICKSLRKGHVETPIIMMITRARLSDARFGFEFVADDYVTKPINFTVLQARVKAILRRFNFRNKTRKQVLQFGTVEIDVDRHEVRKNGKEVRLTSLEFSILVLLLRARAKVLSRDEILDSIWGDDVLVEPRTVDAHIANLRKKIEDNPANPEWIISIRGVGYKIIGT